MEHQRSRKTKIYDLWPDANGPGSGSRDQWLAWVHSLESDVDRKTLIAAWHKEKTAIYQEIISSGAILPRSGIKRIAEAALAAGWQVAVASTSAGPSVESVLNHAVGDCTAKRISVFAGDIVTAKKPAPDIYLLAIKKMDL